MARIAGVDLPKNKIGEVGLSYLFGVGRSGGRKILLQAGIDPFKKVKDWDDEDLNKIRTIINNDWKV